MRQPHELHRRPAPRDEVGRIARAGHADEHLLAGWHHHLGPREVGRGQRQAQQPVARRTLGRQRVDPLARHGKVAHLVGGLEDPAPLRPALPGGLELAHEEHAVAVDTQRHGQARQRRARDLEDRAARKQWQPQLGVAQRAEHRQRLARGQRVEVGGAVAEALGARERVEAFAQPREEEATAVAQPARAGKADAVDGRGDVLAAGHVHQAQLADLAAAHFQGVGQQAAIVRGGEVEDRLRLPGATAARLGVHQHAVDAGGGVAHDEPELVFPGLAPRVEERAAVGAPQRAHRARGRRIDLAHARQQRLAAREAREDLLRGLGLALHPRRHRGVAHVLGVAPGVVDRHAVEAVAHRLRRQRCSHGHAGKGAWCGRAGWRGAGGQEGDAGHRGQQGVHRAHREASCDVRARPGQAAAGPRTIAAGPSKPLSGACRGAARQGRHQIPRAAKNRSMCAATSSGRVIVGRWPEPSITTSSLSANSDCA